MADPTKTVGQNIVVSGLYDLSVSETMARLIQPGDTVIDAGANVGYTTLLAAVAAGPRGRVVSFEPHPELFAVIERNIDAVREKFRIANTELHNAALGDHSGAARLWVPPHFVMNDGISRVAFDSDPEATTLSVKMETIDEVLDNDSADFMKIDVEGYELQVLQGAARALESRRIRHILFEDHNVTDSKVVQMLTGLGFQVFSLGYSMRGLVVRPVEVGSQAKGLEAPNFVATIEPNKVHELCRSPGWLALSRRLSKRCSSKT